MKFRILFYRDKKYGFSIKCNQQKYNATKIIQNKDYTANYTDYFVYEKYIEIKLLCLKVLIGKLYRKAKRDGWVL